MEIIDNESVQAAADADTDEALWREEERESEREREIEQPSFAESMAETLETTAHEDDDAPAFAEATAGEEEDEQVELTPEEIAQAWESHRANSILTHIKTQQEQFKATFQLVEDPALIEKVKNRLTELAALWDDQRDMDESYEFRSRYYKLRRLLERYEYNKAEPCLEWEGTYTEKSVRALILSIMLHLSLEGHYCHENIKAADFDAIAGTYNRADPEMSHDIIACIGSIFCKIEINCTMPLKEKYEKEQTMMQAETAENYYYVVRTLAEYYNWYAEVIRVPEIKVPRQHKIVKG